MKLKKGTLKQETKSLEEGHLVELCVATQYHLTCFAYHLRNPRHYRYLLFYSRVCDHTAITTLA